MKKVVCISGKAEHGKTTVANLMKARLERDGYRVVIVPFADYLKFVAKYWGWNGEKDEAGRGLLQMLGTDKVRKRNMDFWVRAVYQFVEIFAEDFDYVLCDDTRFPNEIEYFRDRGIEVFLMRVIRPKHKSKLTEEQLKHYSETALNNYPHDFYLTAETGCLPEFIEQRWQSIERYL